MARVRKGYTTGNTLQKRKPKKTHGGAGRSQKRYDWIALREAFMATGRENAYEYLIDRGILKRTIQAHRKEIRQWEEEKANLIRRGKVSIEVGRLENDIKVLSKPDGNRIQRSKLVLMDIVTKLPELIQSDLNEGIINSVDVLKVLPNLRMLGDFIMAIEGGILDSKLEEKSEKDQKIELEVITTRAAKNVLVNKPEYELEKPKEALNEVEKKAIDKAYELTQDLENPI